MVTILVSTKIGIGIRMEAPSKNIRIGNGTIQTTFQNQMNDAFTCYRLIITNVTYHGVLYVKNHVDVVNQKRQPHQNLLSKKFLHFHFKYKKMNPVRTCTLK